MNANAVGGAVYGLLEAHRYCLRAPGASQVVLISIVETLINAQKLAPECLPDTEFGHATIAALSPVFDPERKFDSPVLRAIASTCELAICPPRGANMEVLLPRHFYSLLISSDAGVQAHAQSFRKHIEEGSRLTETGTWDAHGDEAMYRTVATAFRGLIAFVDSPYLSTLDRAFQITCETFAFSHPVADLLCGAANAILGAVGGARLGADTLGPQMRRTHDRSKQLQFDASGGDRYQLHGLLALMQATVK